MLIASSFPVCLLASFCLLFFFITSMVHSDSIGWVLSSFVCSDNFGFVLFVSCPHWLPVANIACFFWKAIDVDEDCR